MESGCFCGVDDRSKCRCLPAHVPRGQRGYRYVNRGRGGAIGGNARGGQDQGANVDRDGSSWRDRDGSAWRGRDGSAWRDRDGSSWRDRGGNPRGAMDRGTRGGRNSAGRVKSPLLPLPRGNDGEGAAWRGGRGRSSNGPDQGGAPGNATAWRADRIDNEMHDGSSYPFHYDEGFEGYYDDVDKSNDYYYNGEEGTVDYRGYGTAYGDFDGGRGAYFQSRGAGRGQLGVRGIKNSRKRGARLRGSGARGGRTHSCSGTIEDRPNLDHDSDSEQQIISVKNESRPSRKNEKDKNLPGRSQTSKKIAGKSTDNMNVADKEGSVHGSKKGNSSTSHNNRKSRSSNKDGEKCPLANSRSRNNSASSNGSNRSRNTSDSSVNAKNSREKKGNSYSCSSESESGRSVGDNRLRKSDSSRKKSGSSRKKSDSSRKKSDISRKSDSSLRLRDDRRRNSESSRSERESGRSDGDNRLRKSDSSRKKSASSRRLRDDRRRKSESSRSECGSSRSSSSRSSSASSSCSGEGKRKCSKSRNNHLERGQKDCTKSGNKHKALQDKHVDNSTKNISTNSKRDRSRKSLHTSNRKRDRNSENHSDENSSNKFSHTQGSKKVHGSSDESNETKAKATSETKTSKESSHRKSGESSSSKNHLHDPSKVIKIGNAYVMDGADPLVLTEEEYKFMIGSGTSSPQIGGIVNTTQSLSFSPDSSSSKVITLTEGSSQKSGTAPIPVIRYEWQFQDEQGSWITYGQPSAEGIPAFATTVSSDDIEKHYINDPNKQPVEIESNSVRYVLDFATMTQTNKHTAYKRSIRRVLKRPQAQTAPIKLLKSGSAGIICYEWQFQDEHGVWITYGQPSTKGGPESATTVSSDDIEKHYIIDPSKQTVEVQSNCYHYILDFKAMTQTNKQTSGQRRIRRVPKHRQNQRADSHIGVDAGGLTNEQHEWQFQDEHQSWIRYGSPSSGGDLSCVTTVSSDDIENHYCNDQNKSPFLIQNKKYQYLLNFQTMTQTNQHTKTQRSIRRVASQAPKSTRTQKTPNKDVPSAFEYEWFFLDESNRWIAYGQPNSQNKLECVTSITSDDIEKHYQQDSKKKFYVTSQQHQYLVNFVEMTQTNALTNTVRIIRRLKKNSSAAHSARGTLSRDSFSESMPDNWSPMPSSSPWIRVALKSSDPEYTSHIGAIQIVVPNINVANMYRVQNKYLWKAYANKKEYLTQQFPGINYKEQFLYHGTDPANVEAICKENIDWRLHGSKHGNSYGRGSYFSNSAQMSAGYSTGQNFGTRATYRNPSSRFAAQHHAVLAFSALQQQGLHSASHQYGALPGVYLPTFTTPGIQQHGLFNATQQPPAQPAPTKAMFIVRVLVGNITQGNSSTVRPPVDGSGQPYDTTVNNVANPTIFVKYDTQEYYPEYYVEFL